MIISAKWFVNKNCTCIFSLFFGYNKVDLSYHLSYFNHF